MTMRNSLVPVVYVAVICAGVFVLSFASMWYANIFTPAIELVSKGARTYFDIYNASITGELQKLEHEYYQADEAKRPAVKARALEQFKVCDRSKLTTDLVVFERELHRDGY
jgi:hypothetical protein